VIAAPDVSGLISDAELMRLAGISRAQFYRLKKRGFFDFLMARPSVPGASRYCGALVQRWVSGKAGGPVRRGR
jgi:predicted DNA-binding transcriptional regulator AlpA